MKNRNLAYALILGLSFIFTTKLEAQEFAWNWTDKPGSLYISVGAPSTLTLAESAKYARQHRGMNYYGAYSINYDYNILKWLAVGAKLSYEGWQFKGQFEADNNILQDAFRISHRTSALLNIRFTYINREHVQLYSAVGLGMSYIFKTEDSEKYNYLGFAGSVTPIGVHLGAKNIYALAEIGLGTEALMSIGMGFKL